MHAVLGIDLQAWIAVVAVADDFVHPRRAVTLLGASYKGKLIRIGTVGSFRVKWRGWSSSWLVLEMNTEDSLSKLITPSGLGYSIFGHFVGFLKFGVVRLVVEGPRRLTSEQVGIERRIGDRRPQPPTERRLDVANLIELLPQPALAELLGILRHLVRAATGRDRCKHRSAATVPDFIAVWVPLILGMLRKPAVSPIKPPGKISLGMD